MDGISSMASQKHRKSFTTALASALLEWLLIFMLLVDAIFGYLITKFARYCELPIPCLLCSRIDHILGSEKVGFYKDLICGKHKLEISSLVFCHFHDKLNDVRGMCESCLFSFATKGKSNAETYRLLVGKLGAEDLSGFDEDPLLDDHKPMSSNMKHCCCCNVLFTSRRHAQTLLQTRSIGFDANDLDLPLSRDFRQDWDYSKKEVKNEDSLVTSRLHAQTLLQTRSIGFDAHDLDLPLSRDFGHDWDDSKKEVKNEDLLVNLGYTELKISSDTDSEIQVSDNEDTRALISNDPLRDLILDSTQMEPFITASEDDYACNKLINQDVLSPEPSQTVCQVQSDITEPHGGPSPVTGHGLEELKWQGIDHKLDPSPSTELINVNDVPQSSNGGILSPDFSKEGLDIIEAGVAETLGHETGKIQELDSSQITTNLSSSTMKSDHNNDGGLQIPNYLELGDAYKLAVGNRGRQLSGKLTEQLAGRDSPRVSGDLKLFLSQLSRGFELPDILSPRVSRNIDELGMKLLQKRLSLEKNDSKTSIDRNESGFESLDFSTVSVIEGECENDRFKRQHEHDRRLMGALLKELEEERNASAIAVSEAMAMINRLQEEKAALQMEASQEVRMMEEQAEYDMEALEKLNELMAEKEKEIQVLEAELEYYRTKYPNESFLENVGGSVSSVNSDVLADKIKSNTKDICLEIEDEREYISRCLNDLELKLNLFSNGDQIGKCDEGPQLNIEMGENGVISPKDDFISKENHRALVRRVQSFKNPRSAEQGSMIHKEADIVALGNEVLNLNERLQALEADRNFLERAIDTLKNGDEGLIQEIASHLRELRRIGVRRYQGVS